MPKEVAFPVAVVERRLGPRVILAEALFYPEISRIANTREQSRENLLRNLEAFIGTLPTAQLAHRRPTTTSELQRFSVEIPPPRGSEAWRQPVTLHLRAIVWKPTSNIRVARVLELGIDVLANADDDLLSVLQRDSLAAIRRLKFSNDLRSLAPLQAATATALSWHSLSVSVPTLKERAIQAETEEQPKITILQTTGTRLKAESLAPAFGLSGPVTAMREALTAKPPQSVLLVGPSGVGKTAAVRQLVIDWPSQEQKFYQTSGSRIVAGQSGFGMWEQRCQDIIKEAAKQQAILHLGNLIELIDVGKSECNPTGIASFLRPAIARGDLLCIAECTPEQLPMIEKEDPLLLEVFRTVELAEPDTQQGRQILLDFARANQRRTLDPQALAAIDRLHRRYATYSAYPGRPLRFLDRLRRDGPEQTTIDEAEVYAAFTRETGLPRAILDPQQQLRMAEVERWFSQRVVGQSEAVQIVTQLLATVKAGLARPNRPIASLLFIGPTGVGKTEMAKALAEFLFGSRDRLTRFDMSEYGDPVAVRRLVGGAFGREGLLTAAIREQPFTVLLLDEIEKADRSAFDLLLQALGEARLTDAGGRLADFRNTVVIMTSNLGAETFQRGKTGFVNESTTTASAAEHFQKAVEAALRPEMFNRLDRIVPFAPLAQEIIRRIADREWHKVQNREGLRYRGVKLDTTPTLLDHIAAKGFDPRYGARPLKRAMERQLLAPLAEQLNRFTAEVPLDVKITIGDAGPRVQARPLQGAKPRQQVTPSSSIGQLATQIQNLRRFHQLLETSGSLRSLENERYQLGRLVRRTHIKQALKKPLNAEEVQALADHGRVQELLRTVADVRQACYDLEDRILVAFHADAEAESQPFTQDFDAANQAWDDLLFQLYRRTAQRTDRVVLGLFSENPFHLQELEQAYRQCAKVFGLKVMTVRYFVNPLHQLSPQDQSQLEELSKRGVKAGWARDHLYQLDSSQPRFYLRRELIAETNFHLENQEGWIGSGLQIQGEGAFLRFGLEAGLHKIKRSSGEEVGDPNVLVQDGGASLGDFMPEESLTRRGQISAPQVRRMYHAPEEHILDLLVNTQWPWSNNTTQVLQEILQTMSRVQLMRIVLD